MGYSYDVLPNGRRGGLNCDNCGATEGTRKRVCPHKVLTSAFRTYDGKRRLLAYCQPPALCGPCLKLNGGGGKRGGVHAMCAENAAQSQIHADAEQAALDSGAFLVTSASGSWHEDCPEGMALVTFANAAGAKLTRLVPDADYQMRGPVPTLDEFPTVYPLDTETVGP